ncbi:MAG TPA: hypothetical protein VG798_01030 [Rhizomicrobium sp.]|nr:hypothetical protein [Rhizomicrobium sp.]
MRKIAGAASLAILIAMPAWADGASNIGLTEYPGPSCPKPQRPPEPVAPAAHKIARIGGEETYNPDEVEAYNQKLQQFNQAIPAYKEALTGFNACIKSYIDNGNADMARIKQRLDRAVADANARN